MKAIAWLILSLTLFLTMGSAAPLEARPARTSCVGDLPAEEVVQLLTGAAGERRAGVAGEERRAEVADPDGHGQQAERLPERLDGFAPERERANGQQHQAESG